MNFGQAIEALKVGKKVSRKGWNGKGMYIYLVGGQTLPKSQLVNEAKAKVNKDGNDDEPIKINSHIDMMSADGSIVVGWLASQTDMLSDDWEIK